MAETRDKSSLLDRLNRTFGPLAGAMILDLVDLATIGPLGLGGLFIGTGVGYWMLGNYHLSVSMRWTLSVIAGIYCMIPFTEFIPAATLVTALARYLQKPVEK